MKGLLVLGHLVRVNTRQFATRCRVRSGNCHQDQGLSKSRCPACRETIPEHFLGCHTPKDLLLISWLCQIQGAREMRWLVREMFMYHCITVICVGVCSMGPSPYEPHQPMIWRILKLVHATKGYSCLTMTSQPLEHSETPMKKKNISFDSLSTLDSILCS